MRVKVLCLLIFWTFFLEGIVIECAQGEDGIQVEQDLLEKMDFSNVQSMLDEFLGRNRFSFEQTVKNIMSGKSIMSKGEIKELLQYLFFTSINEEKKSLFKILILVIFAAVFRNLAAVFESGQTSETGFYVVYLLIFSLLMNIFSDLSQSLGKTLFWISDFMQVLSPAYFLAVAASDGAMTASVFSQGVLLLVWGIQKILLYIILPFAQMYILLKLINHLSKEEMLGKMTELTGIAVSWGLKTLLGVTAGLQIVKNMIAPVIDSLKRTALGKTAAAIPGVGNAVNIITELVVTSAVLVRNSLGVAVLLVLVLVGAGPVIHYGSLAFLYRFLSAVSQPVSDKRIVGCLSTMGEGCEMLLKIMLTSEILCMVTFLVIFSGVG